jgi:uncharacterized membrane protein
LAKRPVSFSVVRTRLVARLAHIEAVRDRLLQLMTEHVIGLEDAVIVDRDETGRVKLHQLHSPAARGAAGGALWGGLIGLLSLGPLLGMAVMAFGAAAGGASGALVDVGVSDDFMGELGQKLPQGGSALIVLVRKVTPDKVLPQISQFGGEVIQTSLDDEAEARLREALELGEAAAHSAA